MGSKRRRHTPDQIIRKLAEGHKMLAAGKDLEEFCRHLEVRGVDLASVARAVRRDEGQRRETAQELEGENARLKKLLAEAELDKAMLREISEGNF